MDTLASNDYTEICLQNIHNTFDPGKKCLGIGWRINFIEEDLKKFITNLSREDRVFLSKLVSFYNIHTSPLYKLLEEEKGTLGSYLGERAWSIFSLITIMSILDKYTKRGLFPKGTKEFLLKNIPIKSDVELKDLWDKYKQKEPDMPTRMANLLQKNLSEAEIARIIIDYRASDIRGGKRPLPTIKKICEDLWGEVRSGFVHETGLNVINNESTMFNIKENSNVIEVFSNLSMSNILFLCWKAILKDMGYTGKMDSNYTKEEQKSGVTADGHKIPKFSLG